LVEGCTIEIEIGAASAWWVFGLWKDLTYFIL